MTGRYLIHIIWVEVILRLLNFAVFPISYFTKPTKGFLWWFLHDGNMYGDKYFNHEQKETFWWAYKWAIRNPLHNYYYSHTITGKKEDYKGWATIQKGKEDSGKMWRTVKTKDAQGNYQHKYGKYIDIEKSILGVQRITFGINGRKYFRYSGAKPVNIWKNVWWFIEYKFGFESVNWAIQFKPFKFKKFNGEIVYNKIEL